jgi:hypothetical protein
MADKDEYEGFGNVDPGRRGFIKKFAAAAFIAPVIATFALDGIASADTNQHHPNQHFPNQHFPNQHFPNQLCPGEYHPNQHDHGHRDHDRHHHGHRDG